ncbi:hypothetical protein CM9_02435 [Mycoplasmoides genitalium M2321]|nr:hypothetical protein CM9_02435 [Mycoplasmoides genitalium M2321]AFQ03732.1 hypothetical protein CM3_02555 [Mycoplasmoides genitalium M6282]AFQ04746.1 hypothetical protein CM5_02390 [Mycoplasmoides genitalium M2288]
MKKNAKNETAFCFLTFFKLAKKDANLKTDSEFKTAKGNGNIQPNKMSKLLPFVKTTTAIKISTNNQATKIIKVIIFATFLLFQLNKTFRC